MARSKFLFYSNVPSLLVRNWPWRGERKGKQNFEAEYLARGVRAWNGGRVLTSFSFFSSFGPPFFFSARQISMRSAFSTLRCCYCSIGTFSLQLFTRFQLLFPHNEHAVLFPRGKWTIICYTFHGKSGINSNFLRNFHYHPEPLSGDANAKLRWRKLGCSELHE